MKCNLLIVLCGLTCTEAHKMGLVPSHRPVNVGHRPATMTAELSVTATDLDLKQLSFAAFFVWSFPLNYYRSSWRQLVYETDDWIINVQPRFLREAKVLLGAVQPEDLDVLDDSFRPEVPRDEYCRELREARSFYRFYLSIYALLAGVWLAI